MRLDGHIVVEDEGKNVGILYYNDLMLDLWEMEKYLDDCRHFYDRDNENLTLTQYIAKKVSYELATMMDYKEL